MPRKTRYMDNRVANYDVAVGMRLRVLRVAAAMSQQQLAEQVGVSFQQIQKYERGSNRMSLALACRLAEIFGVPLSVIAVVEGSDGVDPSGSLARLSRGRSVAKLEALPLPVRSAITALINTIAKESKSCP